MNRSYTLTILCLLGSWLFAVAQEGAKRNIAQKYFAHTDYAKAAPIYDELAARTVKKAGKGKPVDWEYVRRAGVCNFHIRNYPKAADAFAVLDKNHRADAADYLLYFESLRYQGRYDEAEKCLQQLARLDSSDGKIKTYAGHLANYQKLSVDSNQYKITELPFNKGLGDFGPAFYDKGLIYASARANSNIGRRYAWDNSYFLNVYYSEKSGDGFRKAGKLQRKKLKTKPHDGPVYFSADGREAFITRNRTEKGTHQFATVHLGLYIIRKDEKGKWGKPEPFLYNNPDYSIGHAALSPDGNVLYFASDMPGGLGGVDLWKSVRQGNTWGKPENLGPKINTEGNDLFPYLSPEGHLYFASDGWFGLGGLDIFEACSIGGKFLTPENPGYPLNTHADDFALITEPGRKTGYFSSDRGNHVDRIYGVKMPPLFLLEGLVKTVPEDSSKAVPGAVVILHNKTVDEFFTLRSDSAGKFYARLNRESDYAIMAHQTDYELVAPVLLSTKNLTESENIRAEVLLEPIRAKELDLFVLLKDCRTGALFRNRQLYVKDSTNKVNRLLQTDSLGQLALGKWDISALYGKPADAFLRRDYELSAASAGYLPDVKKVSFVLSAADLEAKNKKRETVLQKEACIDKIKEGDKFELKDIYYDYNKATLRPESLTELDRAYDFLIKNPGIRVQLSSHTDSRGSDSYNLGLSQRRAQSCVDYLVKTKGFPADRIVAKGYGETQLINGCKNGAKCTEEEHQQNRRTEIRVLRVIQE